MPEWKMPYIYLNSSVECVDDTNSKFYNQIVDRSTVAPDWNSSEQMLRVDDLWALRTSAPSPGHPYRRGHHTRSSITRGTGSGWA